MEHKSDVLRSVLECWDLFTVGFKGNIMPIVDEKHIISDSPRVWSPDLKEIFTVCLHGDRQYMDGVFSECGLAVKEGKKRAQMLANTSKHPVGIHIHRMFLDVPDGDVHLVYMAKALVGRAPGK